MGSTAQPVDLFVQRGVGQTLALPSLSSCPNPSGQMPYQSRPVEFRPPASHQHRSRMHFHEAGPLRRRGAPLWMYGTAKTPHVAVSGSGGWCGRLLKRGCLDSGSPASREASNQMTKHQGRTVLRKRGWLSRVGPHHTDRYFTPIPARPALDDTGVGGPCEAKSGRWSGASHRGA
jgi:hypothetical protein